MSYNAKNYTEQGGEKTVIGGALEISGTLQIKEGALILGLPVAETQAESTAEDVASLVTDFNALLAKLKVAGFIGSE